MRGDNFDVDLFFLKRNKERERNIKRNYNQLIIILWTIIIINIIICIIVTFFRIF